MVERVGASDVTSLLQGPTGSGKEVLARLTHDFSPRRDGPFVPVNCAALPEELAESLLFGHLKGSFTGATRDTEGFFRQAHSGTLFLDEIGELTPQLQAKLLRAIQEKEVLPVGSSDSKKVDVRIVSATNRNLRDPRFNNGFREDLYFRISTFRINVPSLSSRLDDVLPLANFFVLKHSPETSSIQFSPEAIAKRKEVSEKILGNISVGYQIQKTEYTEDDKVLVTRWLPIEISLVAVPLDNSIGVNRSHPSYSTPKEESKKMSTSNYVSDYVKPQVDHAEFEHEARQFSIVKAIQASASGDWNQAGREREVSQELARQYGQRSPQGVLIPNQSWAKRTFVTSSSGAGGAVVATDVLADQFVDALRPNSVVMQAGATVIPSLVGNVSIPKRATSSTAEWFGADDADSITETTGSFSTVSMSPKTIGVYSKFSRLMQLQSTPQIEDLIRKDFLELLATGIDVAALAGTGSSNQPTGILSQSGTSVLALGTNGAALTVDNLLTLKKNVSAANADDGTCAYVINSKVESAISQLKDGNSAYLLNPYEAQLGESRLAGRRLLVSNNVPSNLTKGSGSNLSAAIYGRWSDLLIGQWSGIELMTDPYSDFAKGSVGVRALSTIDIGVRHGASFSLVKDAIAA